jgi:hypothetical protein
MNKFCIATLTHNSPGRDNFLKHTIDSFLQQYTKEIDWFIFCNGKNESIERVVEEGKKRYLNCNFIYKYNEKNLGVGGGINQLNEMVTDYEYVLFLEGDWILCPEDVSGININWVEKCIELLDIEEEIDFIFLRRYTSDYEHRQFTYGYYILPSNIQKHFQYSNFNFYEFKNKPYTNNPGIRRQKRFFEERIFPLDEFLDENGSSMEIKGNELWGKAEINAEHKTKNIKSVNLELGVFVHCDNWHTQNDWISGRKVINSCNKYNVKGMSKCKYGFLINEDKFCVHCDHSKDFTDLSAHDGRYIKSLNDEN